MPKIVNHDHRRTEIVRAVIKVISEYGLNGTTVRSISRAGGFSSGVLSHYFTDKDQMIKFAFGEIADMVFLRIAQRLKSAVGVMRVRVIIEEHLPLRNDLQGTAVSIAFWEVALHDLQLRDQFKLGYGRWRSALRTEVSAILPKVSPQDLDQRVDLAIAMTDGLLVSFALDGSAYPVARRKALVQAVLRVLGLEETSNTPVST